MPAEVDARRWESYALGETLAARIFPAAARHESAERFLDEALPLVRATVDARYVGLLRGEKGTWRSVASTGSARSLPEELLSDVLDREQPIVSGEWCAAALFAQSAGGEVLLVRGMSPAAGAAVEAIDALAALLGAALALVRERHKQQRRVERLETVLDIAASWNQTLEMDSLLEQMAQASTQLLAAERASIFLWDRPNRTLVGRPALGVEEGELRIADDTGVVGQVVQTGESRRVDADIVADQSAIDRQVDKQLGFRTRSLLCVPLRGKEGELFGAFEVINKIGGNFTSEDEAALEELAGHAAIALENTQEHEQLLRTRNHLTDQAAQGAQLLGNCPAIEALRSTVRRVADADLAILILGENGSGKEVVAQMVHYLSSRRNEPLVAVNCASITETLLESELFGHEKGAFTDARETRQGKFELAARGTLFLDEIGDMSLGGQAKLLRVLEEKTVVRVGGSTPIYTDARVIAATNQNLAELVRQRKFREDLYYRLNAVTLELPPLRERGDDVLMLAEHFLQEACRRARRKPPKFTPQARARLLAHTWPGNVRELRNQMERLAYLAPGERIEADELAFILSPDASSPPLFALDLPLTEATRRFQAEYVKKQIKSAGGNMTEVARRLGLHRSNLYRKLRQLDLPVDGG